ncbi:hypothetical protein PARC_a3238 [Pseudoalteromonas arctica A 37-1-2]|uniref:Uncharacterized protein n=1 Tax=Pseudoalteromonas arctica A 37-1-2 TaxID=1117313 RepID=A0A290S6C9_9GAMM|nr:hypothetical protein PARC_a3238 [Pseudoalteromonas arctica A 37-1-2]
MTLNAYQIDIHKLRGRFCHITGFASINTQINKAPNGAL